MLPTEEQPFHLVTKIFPPRLAGIAIPRDAIKARLASFAARRLTLVSASAGYGKTTSICLWLSTLDRSHAWLSLDKHDNNLRPFVRYLLAAIQSTRPNSCLTTAAYLESVPLAEPYQLADVLLNDLAELTAPLVIVLDDYHAIEDHHIHAFMSRVVTHLVPEVHFVIITRADPPFPLARMRLEGQLAEIRSKDLRFTESEASQLLRDSVDLPLQSDVVEKIDQLAEGWPVGLKLAAISLQQKRNPEAVISQLSMQPDRVFADYLFAELLQHLDPPLQVLLARTAIFERLSEPLVELVRPADLAVSISAEFISSLWTSSFFLSALDLDGTWYRFHHLVRKFLLQQLALIESPETVRNLHLQASVWFLEHGLLKEAVEHACLCGDESYMVRSAEAGVYDAIIDNNWRLLELWLDALPNSMKSRPLFMVAEAYLQHFLNNFDAVPTMLVAAAARLAEDTSGYSNDELRKLDGLIQALHAMAAAILGEYEEAINHAEQAELKLPESIVSILSFAQFARYSAMIELGHGEAMLTNVRTQLRSEANAMDARLLRKLLAFAQEYYFSADLALLNEIALYIEYVAQRIDQPFFKGWSNFCLGWFHYQCNELDVSAEYFTQTIEARDSVHLRAYADCICGLALSLYGLGKPQETKQHVANLYEFARKRGIVKLMLVAESLETRLVIRGAPRGYSSKAKLTISLLPTDGMNIEVWEWPVLTVIREHLWRQSSGALKEADTRLRVCGELLQTRRITRHSVEVAVLNSKLNHLRGNSQAALEALRVAVDLAAPGGALRLVADDAGDLEAYLVALRDADHASGYVDEVLAVVASDTQLYRTTSATPTGRAESNGLIAINGDTLTNRELEVLDLVKQGLTNKEIASSLSLSPSTVRKYTISIYDKLQVSNRTQAAAKARQLNLGPLHN